MGKLEVELLQEGWKHKDTGYMTIFRRGNDYIIYSPTRDTIIMKFGGSSNKKKSLNSSKY